MWTCSKCGEQHEDNFNACWKCSDQTQPEDAARLEEPDPIRCPRCDTVLDYVGNKRFREGGGWGVLGDLGELFARRERFDVYVCPRCGRVEFFIDGIGDESRPKQAMTGGLTGDEAAFALCEQATKREIKGDIQGALAMYEHIARRFPDTDASRDAIKSIESLRRKTL